ncbi:flagellar basal body rod protein FlgB [Polymorphum gilvum]|uniref:Flagellar basal body rod protein FlgB n=1 Tax=Polymorphum gilvum (strain LMG 25793 / CGMCC 1.9160 / SL003B-26A1) TaxID=991905 RepID=F2J448_POLGS|nr:flagellar basal body rod protein FlgB [Polymorphum gilvum]ADZ69974.1 Flagellar basal-body rod protein B [Polymorphum gilvum SL003B-26A1]
MALTNLPMFQALKSKMQWHQTRQSLLSENVANADSPQYRARDLKPFDLSKQVDLKPAGLATARTQAGHLPGVMTAASKMEEASETFETTPNGNNVVLEEQMMKVTENQMDFQAATALYTRSIGLIRTALSKSA